MDQQASFFFFPLLSFVCRTIYICSVSSSSPVAVNTFKAHKDEVNAICWSPCGNYVASCSDDCTAKIWNVDLSSTSSSELENDENSGSPIKINSFLF